MIFKIGITIFIIMIAGAVIFTIIQSWKINKNEKKRKKH